MLVRPEKIIDITIARKRGIASNVYMLMRLTDLDINSREGNLERKHEGTVRSIVNKYFS